MQFGMFKFFSALLLTLMTWIHSFVPNWGLSIVLTTLTLNYEQALLEEKNDMPILNTLDAGDLPTEKSGPSRSLLMVSALIVAGLATHVMARKRPTVA